MKNKKPAFEEILLPYGYAMETLINGNISHCIEYLRQFHDYGISGSNVIASELELIKEHCPARYPYVKEKVFSPKK